MPTPHLVDLLLLAVVLAYVPIGAWRGGLREGVLGAGLVVTGALMISPPINWLSDAVQDRTSNGRLVVSLFCLGLGLVLGVGGGGIVERHASTARGCLVGAMCGLANALWVGTFFLVQMDHTAEASAFNNWLSGGLLFPLLVSHNEVALLALSTTVLALSGFWTMHLLWLRLGTESDRNSVWTPHRRALPRHRSVSFPKGEDSGKLEPVGTGTSISLSRTVTVGRHAATVRQHRHGDLRRRTPGCAKHRADELFNQQSLSGTWYRVTPPPDSGVPTDGDH